MEDLNNIQQWYQGLPHKEKRKTLAKIRYEVGCARSTVYKHLCGKAPKLVQGLLSSLSGLPVSDLFKPAKQKGEGQ